MPTASDLTGNPQLGLTLRAGSAGADRPISWVHASELTDPTQFLSGSELLLTTGIALPETEDGQAAYVGRLAAAGLSGLGFGIQLGHDEIPKPLLAAAEAAHLPVLEVPHRTPFIEISKAVSQALADTRSAEARRFETARNALTTAAVHGEDLGGLIGRLATELACWAVLLSPDGTVTQAEPAAAAEHVPALAPDLDRLRAARLPSSIGLSADGGHVAAHSLGGGHKLAGFLVVGREHAFGSTDHHITHAAASLLSIALIRTRTTADTRLRTTALKLLLTGHRTAFDELADPLGMRLPDEPVVVLAGSGHSPTLVDGGASSDLLAGELDGELIAVASASQQLPSARHLGVSPPTGLDGLPAAYRQARQALSEATRRGTAVVRFDDLGVGLLRDVADQGVVTRAEAMLRPLYDHDAGQRGELVRSLRSWLAHHGHWDPAAAELGVHRHTLRHRMSKVAALLDCNVDSPDVRAQLWLAIRLVA
ncbi:purine catabolism regulator [Prauserella sediminis]|uniref:Purine catabolism regulator n=1 Tax=Prauserella sediminis TaxID=577680 RepID=A0A839XXZ4_9PSEU|nr:PucR family transcriptional regulator [Prauserella sediminis]MBB3664635.1 purine catabolism regulator [Prauserella sediminis]